MTTRKTIPSSALLALLLGSTDLQAADAPTSPRGPVIVVTASSGGCATCESIAPAAGNCASCGPTHPSILQRHRSPSETNLCPGSCFGYFPTQWRKWEEVCPASYPGAITTDPHPPVPYPMIPPSSDKLPKKSGMVPPPPPGPPRVGTPASGTRIN